jgi:hypothetical protein
MKGKMSTKILYMAKLSFKNKEEIDYSQINKS